MSRLNRYTPFAPFHPASDTLRYFSEMHDALLNTFNKSESCDLGHSELYREGDVWTLKLMVPGFSKEEISVEVTKNHIIVEAKQEPTDDTNLVRGKFPTQLSYKELIPASLDASSAEASLDNGVLAIRVKSLDKKTPTSKVTIK